MRLSLNWLQRGLLVAAGVFLSFSALNNAADGYGEWDDWLATLQFMLAVVCFVIAAKKGRADG